MAHANERVELAMQILECRRKMRLMAWDDAATAKIGAEMERLEQKSAGSVELFLMYTFVRFPGTIHRLPRDYLGADNRAGKCNARQTTQLPI